MPVAKALYWNSLFPHCLVNIIFECGSRYIVNMIIAKHEGFVLELVDDWHL